MRGELIRLSARSPHSTASCGLHQTNSLGWWSLTNTHQEGSIPHRTLSLRGSDTSLNSPFSHTYHVLTALGTAKSWTLASWEQPYQQLPGCKTILSENATPRHPTSHARTNNSTLGQSRHTAGGMTGIINITTSFNMFPYHSEAKMDGNSLSASVFPA